MTESSRPSDDAAALVPPAASGPPPAPPPPATPAPALPPPAPAAPPPAMAAPSEPPPAPPPAMAAPPAPPAAVASPQQAPQAVQQAEQVARQVAGQLTTLSRGWWGRLDPQGKKPTLIVAAILLGVVLGTQVLNGILPARAQTSAPTNPTTPNTPGQTPPGLRIIEIAPGVRMQAYAGWQQLESTISLPGVRFQNGGTVLDIRVIEGGNQGDHVGLLTAYMQQLVAPDAQQLTPGGVNIVPINGVNGARVAYSGIFKGVSGTVTGEVTAIVFPGAKGIVVHGFTVDNDLDAALQDIHGMTFTIEVRG